MRHLLIPNLDNDEGMKHFSFQCWSRVFSVLGTLDSSPGNAIQHCYLLLPADHIAFLLSILLSFMIRLIAAGILALPVLLWTLATLPLIIVLSIPPCLLLLVRQQKGKDGQKDPKRQILVTGGSSGIGLAIGKLAGQRSDVVRIVLLARDETKLNHAKQEVLSQPGCKVKRVETYTLDVTDQGEIERRVASVLNATKADDLTTHVFCCAAANASPNYLLETTTETFDQLIRTNQMGSIYFSNACISHMDKGTIQLCSSMAGQVGVFGYAAYSPTKFALRGYAEAVHMELTHRAPQKNVHIQLAFPPDTDTPGFKKENETKPTETEIISDAAGLSSPQDVATIMIKEAVAENPKFQVYFNFDGFMLCTMTSGFTPATNLFDAVSQVSLMSLTRWVALFYLNDWHRMLGNERKKRDSRSKLDSVSRKPKDE